MKTPPFLLGGVLLFWGWQSDLFLPALGMAVILESARWVRVRWDFATVDFERIWTFCALLFLAAAVFAFTTNDVPAAFSNFLDNPTVGGSHNTGTATSRAAAAWIRWQPMLFFLFVVAQTYNSRPGVPAETISLLLRWRWRRNRKLGQSTSGRTIDVSYPYAGVCLLSSCAHASEDPRFFCGLCVLMGWALWPLRSPRFSRLAWAATLMAGLALGYGGQRGLGYLQRYVEALNPQWPFRFGRPISDPLQSRTALGHIGRLQLSGKIVVRLEVKSGQAPEYLREATYRSYRTQVWYSDMGSNDFTAVIETNGTFVLAPPRTNGSVAGIACYLSGGNGLLPLPSGCSQVDNRLISSLERSPLGAVLVQGPGMVMLDAYYGPGPTLDALPVPYDLSVRETAAVDATLAEFQPEGLSDPEKIAALQRFFNQHFQYSLWQGYERRSPTNDPPLTRFLRRTRSGHCEYFATAGVMLLRRMGIPARYAVGYAVHEHSGRHYVVRARDAHAWCLVWNKATGTWEDFDPTPPAWMKIEAEQASLLEPLSDLWSGIVFQFSKFRWGQTRFREYILWALLPLLALLLYQIVFRSQRRRHRLDGKRSRLLQEWPGSDSEFYLLEAKVRERGLVRAPSETLSAWLMRAAADPALADLHGPLQTLLRLHYRLRFDPLGLEPAEREALRREARDCLARLAAA